MSPLKFNHTNTSYHVATPTSELHSISPLEPLKLTFRDPGKVKIKALAETDPCKSYVKEDRNHDVHILCTSDAMSQNKGGV